MCKVLGIGEDGEDSKSDVEDGTMEDQESGDDEIDEELNDEAGIPVDDLGVEVEEMKHDHEYPIISVSTEFSSMHEFRMLFRHFCIKGEFDVYRLKNSAERYEAVCKLTWMNGWTRYIVHGGSQQDPYLRRLQLGYWGNECSKPLELSLFSLYNYN